MKADWLCKLGGQPCGPFTVEQLRQLAAAGTIDATTEIRREKDPRWFLAGKVPGLLSAAALASSEKTAPAIVTPVAAAAPVKPRPRVSPLPPPPVPVGVPARPATHTEASPDWPAALDVGDRTLATSPSTASTSLVFTTKPTTAAASTAKPEKGKAAKPRKSNAPLIVAGSLGGVCLVVAIVGGVLLALGSPSDATQRAQGDVTMVSREAPQRSASSQSAAAGAELNPSAASADGAEGEADGSTAASAMGTRKVNTSSSQNATQALSQIKSWNSLTSARVQFGLKNVARFEVTSVWLAADATGRRIAVKTPSAAKAAGDTSVTIAAASVSPAAPVAELEAAETPLYVFAELKIANTSSGPVKYQGWNAPAETTAILVDQTGALLELVPALETPKVERLAGSFIPPGGIVIDTLVFRAPAAGVQSLRLALPKPALAAQVKGFFAIEIPQETLLRAAAEPAATAFANSGIAGPADAAARNEFADLQRQIMESDAPADVPQATPAASTTDAAATAPADEKMAADKPDPAKPRTAEEFDKLLREMDEKECDPKADPATKPGDMADAKKS